MSKKEQQEDAQIEALKAKLAKVILGKPGSKPMSVGVYLAAIAEATAPLFMLTGVADSWEANVNGFANLIRSRIQMIKGGK